MDKLPTEVIVNGDADTIELGGGEEFALPLNGYDDVNFTYVITVPYADNSEDTTAQGSLLQNFTLDDISFTSTEVKCSSRDELSQPLMVQDVTSLIVSGDGNSGASPTFNFQNVKVESFPVTTDLAAAFGQEVPFLHGVKSEVCQDSKALSTQLELVLPNSLPLETISFEEAAYKEITIQADPQRSDDKVDLGTVQATIVADPSLGEEAKGKTIGLGNAIQDAEDGSKTSDLHLANLPESDKVKETPEGLGSPSKMTVKIPTKGYGKRGAAVLNCKEPASKHWARERTPCKSEVSVLDKTKVPFRRRRLVIDTQKQIPISEFKQQLRDTQDILRERKEVAPAKRKKLTGLGIEKTMELISRPGRFIRGSRLACKYSLQLTELSKTIVSTVVHPNSSLLNSDLELTYQSTEDECGPANRQTEPSPELHQKQSTSSQQYHKKVNTASKRTTAKTSASQGRIQRTPKLKSAPTDAIPFKPSSSVSVANNSMPSVEVPHTTCQPCDDFVGRGVLNGRFSGACYSRKKTASHDIPIPAVVHISEGTPKNKELDDLGSQAPQRESTDEVPIKIEFSSGGEPVKIDQCNETVTINATEIATSAHDVYNEPKNEPIDASLESMEIDFPYLPNHPKTETDHLLEGNFPPCHLTADEVLTLWTGGEISTCNGIDHNLQSHS